MSHFDKVFDSFAVFTWAARPSVTVWSGKIIKISDIGVSGGALFISDGTDWKSLGPLVIGRSNVAIPNSNSTNNAEFNFAAVTIPAGLMGLNGSLWFRAIWTFTGSTNQKIPSCRHSTGSGNTSGNNALGSGTSSATNVMFFGQGFFRNRASAASQFASPSAINSNIGFSAGVAGAPTLDTTAVSYINFNGNKALGTETMTLEWYEVVLLP